MKTPNVHVGDRFGTWVLLEPPYIKEGGIYSCPRGNGINSYMRRWWYAKCRCDCGRESDLVVKNLTRGFSLRCSGCRAKAVKTRHGATANGKTTRLFTTWVNLRARCSNANKPEYHRYGGRGITVCDEWQSSFEAFRDWAMLHGYTDLLTIDRIDVDLPYHPDNCRWADRTVQANNRRSSALVEAWGETKTIAKWLKDPRCAVRGYHTLRHRLQKAFWEPEVALTRPALASKDIR